MSERYGQPGELKEMLESFEDWVRVEIDKARDELDASLEPRSIRRTVGRLETLRDVLDWWGVTAGDPP